jgi:hypothetical protein
MSAQPRMSAVKRLLFIFLGILLMGNPMLSFCSVAGATNEEHQENEGPLPVAHQVQAKQRKDLVDTAAGKVTATIGFTSSVGDATIQALPQGIEVLYRYKYINAVVVVMDKALVSTLVQDSDVEYVQEDSMVHSMAETVPWGIPAIQANDVTVPPPDSSQACFKICIADTGFSVGHEDLVCTWVDTGCCLLLFHLTQMCLRHTSRIRSPAETLLERGSASTWVLGIIPQTQTQPHTGLTLLARSLPRAQTARVL